MSGGSGCGDEAVSARRVVVLAERRRVTGEELHQLGRVEGAATAERDDAVALAALVGLEPGEHVGLGRIRLHPVEQHVDDARLAEHRQHTVAPGRPLTTPAVGHQQRSVEPEAAHLVGEPLQRPGAQDDAGGPGEHGEAGRVGKVEEGGVHGQASSK